MQHVFVTGGTGFIGKHLISALLKEKYQISCFVKESERASHIVQDFAQQGVRLFFGDITNHASVTNAFENAGQIDAVIHLAAIIKPTLKGDCDFHAVNVEGTRHVVEACQARGIQRFIFYSTDFVLYPKPTIYGQTKAKAEDIIRQSNLTYTILRPTPVYGLGDDKNFNTIFSLIRRYPLLPSVHCVMQPVSVHDVVNATLAILANAKTHWKAYNLPGGSTATFAHILRFIAREMGYTRLIVPLPNAVIQNAVRLYEHFVSKPVVRSYQISKWLVTKKLSFEENARDFGYAPVTFEQGMRQTMRLMGLSRQ